VMIENGYELVYEPEAIVYHHHGIHQDANRDRSRSTVQVLSKLEHEDDINSLPESMKPKNIYVAAVCPVLRKGGKAAKSDMDGLRTLIHDLKASRFVNSIHIVSRYSIDRRIADDETVEFIERPKSIYPPRKTLEDVLKFSLLKIEERGIQPDVILYANYLFPKRPPGFFDNLIKEIQYKGMDTFFGGFQSYSNYWTEDEIGGYRPVGDGFKPRGLKRPIYEALHGLGTAISTNQLRQGRMIGEHIGIIPIVDQSYRNKNV
jgi:rhamnosyltransferase